MATQLNDWLSIDKNSGTGNEEITLTASSYEELVDRATSLKIQGISANAILNVKQNALVPKIEVEGDLVFSSYGGERTIRIKSNIEWRFESGDWYNFDKTQGSVNVFTTITVTVDSNGGDERSAVIPIYKKDDDTIIGYITLIQNNANLTVEVPTDVENCFYIEPTVTDGRVIDIQFNFNGSISVDNYYGEAYIYYYEDSTWKKFIPATAWDELHILKIQKRVYFKEFHRQNSYQGWQLNFNMSGEVNVGGDLSVLLGDVDNPYGYKSLYKYACYLFYGCPIVDASQLVLPTKMYYNACSYMFSNCEKLIAAPVLPATTLGADCYWYMFSGCTSLVTPPELPATTLAERCYHRMFDGCTSLATAPALPAVILKNGCYAYMFFGCSNLAHIEMLGAAIGEESLYYWVDGVSESGSFIKAKNANIPIDSNDGIPSGWNVTESGDIPTTTEQLKSSYLWVEFEDTIGEVGSFFNKGIVYSFNGVEWYGGRDGYWGTSTGDNKIVYFANTKDSLHTNTKFSYFSSKAKVGGKINIITTDCNSLFIDNEKLTDASELILPTTLTENCFYKMFYNCTSLTTAPTLPATVLAESCYEFMFTDCTNLNYIKMLATDISATDCLFNWVIGVSETGTFVKHPDATIPTGLSGIPEGWTIETATS